MAKLYLASQSPRRAALLQQIGVEFSQRATNIDEQRQPGELPADYVTRLAGEKAAAGMALVMAENNRQLSVVMGADTIVVKGDRLFGKPVNKADFAAMMGDLSAAEHEVLTAVELLCAKVPLREDRPQADFARFAVLSSTKVRFKRLTSNEVQQYWSTGEPRGKAGGYAIQGAGALLVESISGSYSGVVGLPLYETGLLLADAGITTALDNKHSPFKL